MLQRGKLCTTTARQAEGVAVVGPVRRLRSTIVKATAVKQATGILLRQATCAASRTRDVVVRVAASQGGTRAIKKASQKSGQVFVAGATGQTAIRIVKELLEDGYKVVGGVSDIEEAQEILAVAKQLELIPKSSASNLQLVEVDFNDADDLASRIPKRIKVVVVDGDSLGKRRTDAKFVQTVIDAAEAAIASQLILVSTVGAAGGGFFFGGGGSSSAGKNPKLSKIEELVFGGEVPGAVVRAAGLDKTDDTHRYRTNIKVGGLGEVSGADLASRAQVGQVISELLSLPSSPLVIEVGAAADAPKAELAGLVAEVAQPQIEKAALEAAENAKEAAKAGLFGFGTKKEEKKEEKPKVEEKKVGSGFFTISNKKAAKEEEEEEEVKAKGSGFFFGAKKPAAPAKEEEEEEEKPKSGGLFGFGSPKKSAPEGDAGKAAAAGTTTLRRGGAVARSPRPAAAEEKKPAGGLFGRTLQVQVGKPAAKGPRTKGAK